MVDVDITQEQRAYIDKLYHYETDPIRRYTKGICNIVLSREEAIDILGDPSDEEIELLKNRFGRSKDYQGFNHAEFGVHTMSHVAFDGNVDKYLWYEVWGCYGMLLAANINAVPFFTLPLQPVQGATVDQLAELLKTSANIKGFINGDGEWDQESYVIPRIDAKKIEEFLGL